MQWGFAVSFGVVSSSGCGAGFWPEGISPQGYQATPAWPASGATVVALLLTRAHRLLLSGRVNGFHLLPLPLMNLLDFVPLLRDGKRRVRAHRLPFLPRLLCEDAPLLHRRLGNSGDLPAGFDRRLRRT
jgi:hypothetical protein